jgi:type IV pilus assembly protein PilA
MKKHTTLKSKFNSAFSLVELLVVIAVIAVIAAIAIPNITNVTASASEATKVRNAQQLASTWNNYVEAYRAVNNGDPTAPADAAAAVTTMAAGVSVTNTRLNITNDFRLPGLAATDVATNKITVSGSRLVYTP